MLIKSFCILYILQCIFFSVTETSVIVLCSAYHSQCVLGALHYLHPVQTGCYSLHKVYCAKIFHHVLRFCARKNCRTPNLRMKTIMCTFVNSTPGVLELWLLEPNPFPGQMLLMMTKSEFVITKFSYFTDHFSGPWSSWCGW